MVLHEQSKELGELDDIAEIFFSKEQGAPFNLRFFIDPYECPQERLIELIKYFQNPRDLEWYCRWQLCRYFNPVWKKGSGFEDYLISLSREEILRELREYNKEIIRRVRERDENSYRLGVPTNYQSSLIRFVKDPNTSISLDFAAFMYRVFTDLLTKAKMLRKRLQDSGNIDNQGYMEELYQKLSSLPYEQQELIIEPINNTNFSRLIVPFPRFTIFPYLESDQGLYVPCIAPDLKECDIKDSFPHLAEIGRFGHPFLKYVLGIIQ